MSTNLNMQNFFSTTLAQDITDSSTTIYLNAVPTASEGYLVLEKDSTLKREVIYYTSKGANFVTCPSAAAGRGQGGTTAQAHTAGVSVDMTNVAEYFKALKDMTAVSDDAVLARHIADAQIKNAHLDTTAGEPGGEWKEWTPTLTGWSSNPSGGLYYYTQVGKKVTLSIRQPNNGTSNATTCVFTLPINAVTRTNARWTAPAEIIDNNVSLTTPGMAVIQSGGTTVTVSKSYAFEAMTSSGNKRVSSLTITYEAA